MKLSKKNEKEYKKTILPELPKVPCLTTPDEHRYLYWLARKALEGEAALVEIGTWFGCSAGFLAAGLRDAKKKNELFCFDRFTLSSSENVRVKEQGFSFEQLPVNGDTLPLVKRHLHAIYENSHCIKTEIDALIWKSGPVAVLHLDAPKRAQDIMHVLRIFEPYLIPHESVVVVQDFCVPRAYALPLIFGTLANSFEIAQVPSAASTTATFNYVAPYVIDDRLTISHWPVSRALTMMQHFFPHLSAQQQKMLMIGLAFFCYDVGDKEMAEEIAKNL